MDHLVLKDTSVLLLVVGSGRQTPLVSYRENEEGKDNGSEARVRVAA